VAMLVAVAAIDLEHRIVPNRILAPSALAALVLWALTDPRQVPENILAGLIAGTFLLVFAVIYPAGMGMGDVKLALLLGAMLGSAVVPAAVLGTLAGAAAAAVLLVRDGRGALRRTMPFGPFLAFGAIVTVLLLAP